MECVYTRGKNMFYFPGLFARMWVSFVTYGTIGPSVLATSSVGSRNFKCIYIRTRGKGLILSLGRACKKMCVTSVQYQSIEFSKEMDQKFGVFFYKATWQIREPEA